MDKADVTNIDDRIFDALLKVAAEEALREEMEALPSDEELEKMYPRSESLDRKIYAMINKEKRTARRRAIARALPKVAAVFFMVIVASAGVLMSVEASRIFILNLFIEAMDDHIVIEFGEEKVIEPEAGQLVFGFVPEGFTLESVSQVGPLSIYVFDNGSGETVTVQKIDVQSMTMGADIEYTYHKVVEIDGFEAHFFDADGDGGYNVLMREFRESIITVSSSLGFDELAEILRNISLAP